MVTYRSICSDIQSELKANNIDDRFSFRFLSSRIKDKIKNFVKQDADNRRFSKLSELWRPFPPIQMIEVLNIDYPIVTPNCKTLMKSKKKLPKTYSSNYGKLLRIFNISGEREYTLISKIDYVDIQNREYRDKRIKYAWIEDDYLFIPDSQVEVVKALGFNEETIECDKCAKPLDTELSIPPYLLDIVKKDIVNELMGSTKRVVVDERPDENSNIKQ